MKVSIRSLAAVGAGVAAATAVVVTTVIGPSTSAYDSAIAYSKTRAPFTATRTINVTSASQLKSAITNLRAGDLVKATASFTVPGETVINKRLTAPAVIDLTGATVKFIYQGTTALPGVWINNPAYVRVYGGDVQSPQGGACIVWYGGQHVTWWGFKAHNCAGSGMGVANTTHAYPVTYDDIQGEFYDFDRRPELDNHVEKCSGLHGANLADGNTAAFSNNRFAFYVHDSPCEGGGIQFGTNQASPLPTNNTIYLKCVNLTFKSTIQTGGNCFQTWGYGNRYTTIKYLEANNLAGHPYTAGGLYHKPNSYLATDTLVYGRASNVRTNPRFARHPNWDKTGGTVFRDVAPLP